MAHKRIDHNPAVLVARIVGVGAAGVTILLYCVFLFANPYNRQSLTTGTYVVVAIMAVLALLAAWGAWTSRPWALVIAFVASFLPFGFYLLGTPGVFALIGVANVLYLFAGALISLEQYRIGRR